MSDYQIIRIEDEFFIACEDIQRGGYQLLTGLGTVDKILNNNVVKRGDQYIYPDQTYGNMRFFFGEDEDDNRLIVGNAGSIKISWPQAAYLIRTFKEAADFETKKEMGWDKS